MDFATFSTPDVNSNTIAQGDINGDGLPDLVIGAYPAEVTNEPPPPWPFAGKVFITYGTSPCLKRSRDLYFYADVTFLGPYPNATLGASVTVGDFDADGFDDVAIGAPELLWTIPTGGIYIVFGSASLPSVIPMSAVPSGVRFAHLSRATGRCPGILGVSLASGDIDGDGIVDLVAGDPEAEDSLTGTANCYSGVVYVVWGTPTWPSSIDLAFRQPTHLTINNYYGPVSQMGATVGAADVGGSMTTDVLMDVRNQAWILYGDASLRVMSHPPLNLVGGRCSCLRNLALDVQLAVVPRGTHSS